MFVKLLGLLALAHGSNADCLEAEALKILDYQYEQALRKPDLDWIRERVAEQFVWVHNHAVLDETREMLLERLGDDYQSPKSREQTDVTVIREGDTAVIYGLSTVDKFSDGPRHANRYHYMRTWVNTENGCRLIAAQTMKVWSTESEL
ncbi:nuclear transport factor 2 family protein [Gilvimarinus xylanilyticus]|uniref:Nuclear transport factor 2 family protein n=1 Tax=Gilvimarinus xylanilyticus TaxID=2944139 RepID=A0A9X2KUL2_9GAMM|nr:nuclear transport factor 2 family protein [Gilvimarinus xylanilyticus]MCP8900404.1 nuclear transport factor 2 family protein [Gilvimarinus xylanilyticus]